VNRQQLLHVPSEQHGDTTERCVILPNIPQQTLDSIQCPFVGHRNLVPDEAMDGAQP
jgi:hypothetical protein